MRKTVWYYETINRYTGVIDRFFSMLYVDEIRAKKWVYSVDCLGWIEDGKVMAFFGEFAED
jgi:hypothetical protein